MIDNQSYAQMANMLFEKAGILPTPMEVQAMFPESTSYGELVDAHVTWLSTAPVAEEDAELEVLKFVFDDRLSQLFTGAKKIVADLLPKIDQRLVGKVWHLQQQVAGDAKLLALVRQEHAEQAQRQDEAIKALTDKVAALTHERDNVDVELAMLRAENESLRGLADKASADAQEAIKRALAAEERCRELVTQREAAQAVALEARGRLEGETERLRQEKDNWRDKYESLVASTGPATGETMQAILSALQDLKLMATPRSKQKEVTRGRRGKQDQPEPVGPDEQLDEPLLMSVVAEPSPEVIQRE